MKDRIMNTLLLLTVGLALLFSLKQPFAARPIQVSAEVPLTEEDPVSAYRARRTEQRKREEDTLRSLAADGNCDISLREQAQTMLLELQRRAETETTAEALAIGRGYGDAICTLAGETLLFVLQQPITSEEAACLTELTAEAAGIPTKNIRISANQKPS